MPNTGNAGLLPPETTHPQVRLQTLINLRWLAIVGQTTTVVLTSLALTMSVQLLLCLVVIGFAVAANVLATVIYPTSTRLSDRAAFFFLLFDLAQLAALLFLTGGLNNPFALLFLAPVTSSATALSLRSTLTLGVIAVALITFLGGYHMPLELADGSTLTLPPIFLMGFWAAIVIGTLFLAGFAYRLTLETERMSNALLATQTALAREQKLHDLGGVVAAAAHELGTPLATIKLVSSELAEELADRPDLHEDVMLIRSQADRCRDILRSMGRIGKRDRQVSSAPLEAILREAAEPHADRGITIRYDTAPLDGQQGTGPGLRRTPEVIHGLRNLIQNAVDFAETEIWIEGRWSTEAVVVRVIDDGPGYPADVLSRLGDPFLRNRRRQGYEGMGLGLFISKTLLERTGATIAFFNGSQSGRNRPPKRGGAIAEVHWTRNTIEAPLREGLGENLPFDVASEISRR
ncbi:sensor histidine kinase RegB [Jannaschia pohangensis]|uniref:histidine kinase n=1 Tax=Jannaschia pohangensis TaxID=390807 RepID=A0A1I3U1M0_9RHOB|nr:ActS/PrrB/RegB family redox-sensitive histidine kinase [Jannaschia pohangensis]SFJ75681.1 two-component system, sensor histidine kinase RegB [Jannaschia pohangensis]